MASNCAEGPGRSRTVVHQNLHGVTRGSGRRCQRSGKPRLLRVESLEDRTLLSIAASGADELGFPVTQVATAPLAGTDVTGGGAARPSGIAAVDPNAIASVARSAVVGAASRPNLTPYKPLGWGDKIVVSNVTGTNVGGPLSAADTLYVDWAGLNNGGAAVTTAFSIDLYVDGVLITDGVLEHTWYLDPPLSPNYYTFVEDYAIGQLDVGQHTLRIKLDSANAVAESNESDNSYVKTITVTKPNLTPCKPAGWGDKIVVSSVTGTHVGNALYANSILYVDWAGINNGKVPTAKQFNVELYVDGSHQGTWFSDLPLGRNTYMYGEDYAIGPLSAGRHTIRIKFDATQDVDETNERDNVYTKTITVLPPVMKPNLTPYQPNGWSGRIVVSTGTGTHGDSPVFLDNDELYIDWAAMNNGGASVGREFTSQLWVDGALKQSFVTAPPLDPGSYHGEVDAKVGPLSVGRHTIQIRLDTGGAIKEVNENDNIFTRTITVTSDASIAFVVNYTDSAGEGFFDPQRGAQRRNAFEYALGIWSGLLAKAYEDETITVDASMDPMGGDANGAMLGAAGPRNVRWNFGGNALANTVYGDALANHLAGRDLSSGIGEIVARFNSDVDNQAVLGSIDWYYGTDGAPPNGDVDFVSVLLHEMGHGLNFFDLIDDSTGGWAMADIPGAYDRFLQLGDGTDLTAMTNAGRKSAIVSNNLYWDGENGEDGNGGTRPKMFAPNPYQPGSSVSHTDETLHENDLMSPMYSGPDHSPGPIDLGILADMGWDLRAGAASAMVFGAQTSSIDGAGSWAPFGALVQEEYVRPSSLDTASGLGLSRDWLGAVDRALSDPGAQVVGWAKRSAGPPWLDSARNSDGGPALRLAHPTVFTDETLTRSAAPWSRLPGSEDSLVLRRNIIPGGHVGRFQRDADVVFAGEEQRHLRNRVADGEVFDEGLDDRTADVGRDRETSLAAQDIVFGADLI